MRETFSGTKDCLFFPLYSHFGNESFIILIELQRYINCTDEIFYWIVFVVDIEKIVSAIKRNGIVNNFLELERIIKLFLTASHEVYKLGKLHSSDIMLIHHLYTMLAIFILSKPINVFQLLFSEHPLRFHKKYIGEYIKITSLKVE